MKYGLGLKPKQTVCTPANGGHACFLLSLDLQPLPGLCCSFIFFCLKRELLHMDTLCCFWPFCAVIYLLCAYFLFIFPPRWGHTRQDERSLLSSVRKTWASFLVTVRWNVFRSVALWIWTLVCGEVEWHASLISISAPSLLNCDSGFMDGKR